MEDAYVLYGGYSFVNVFKLFIALVGIWMMFIVGTTAYEYATGRTKEFPVAFTLIRVAVVLSISAIMNGWITA